MAVVGAGTVLRVMWWVLGQGHHTLDRHLRTDTVSRNDLMEMAMPQEHGHFITQAA
jgi:hypothetical protein